MTITWKPYLVDGSVTESYVCVFQKHRFIIKTLNRFLWWLPTFVLFEPLSMRQWILQFKKTSLIDLKVQKKIFIEFFYIFTMWPYWPYLMAWTPCLRDHELYYISRGLHRHHHHAFSLYPLDMEVDFQNFQRLIIFTRGQFWSLGPWVMNFTIW